MDSGVSFTCDGDQGETRFFLHLILSCFQTLIFQALITAIFTVKSTLINQRITGINGKTPAQDFGGEFLLVVIMTLARTPSSY